MFDDCAYCILFCAYVQNQTKQKQYKYRSVLHFTPILAVPLPSTPLNTILWVYRIVGNFFVCYFAFDGDQSALLLEYNFGLFVSIITFTSQALIFFVLVFCFQKSDVFEDMEVNYARTFESLMKNKAYFEVIECLKYGMFSIKETWVRSIYIFF